jgi:hypothetical protein
MLNKRLRELVEQHPWVRDARRNPRCAEALKAALGYHLDGDLAGQPIWGKRATWLKVKQAVADIQNQLANEEVEA